MGAHKPDQIHSPDINTGIQELENLRLVAPQEMDTGRGNGLITDISELFNVVALGPGKDHATKTAGRRLAGAPDQSRQNAGQTAFASDQ